MVPDVGGSMNLRHPTACAALEQTARAGLKMVIPKAEEVRLVQP